MASLRQGGRRFGICIAGGAITIFSSASASEGSGGGGFEETTVGGGTGGRSGTRVRVGMRMRVGMGMITGARGDMLVCRSRSELLTDGRLTEADGRRIDVEFGSCGRLFLSSWSRNGEIGRAHV